MIFCVFFYNVWGSHVVCNGRNQGYHFILPLYTLIPGSEEYVCSFCHCKHIHESKNIQAVDNHNFKMSYLGLYIARVVDDSHASEGAR